MKRHNRAIGVEWILIVAVGIVISALLIIVFVTTTKKAKKAVEPAVEQMAEAGRAMKESNIQALDGEDLEGEDVRNFYAKYLDDYTGTYTSPFEVVINNGVATQTYNTRDYLSAIKDPTDSAHYVKSNNMYHCTVSRNANDEIVQVKFSIK